MKYINSSTRMPTDGIRTDIGGSPALAALAAATVAHRAAQTGKPCPLCGKPLRSDAKAFKGHGIRPVPAWLCEPGCSFRGEPKTINITPGGFAQ